MTKVETGRTVNAPKSRKPQFCKSCEARILFGEPRATDSWESSLALDQRTIDLLLVAAAEFEDIHDEAVADALAAGTPIPAFPTAVDFVDWLAPSALPNPAPYLSDGHPLSKLTSGPRHPDPIPYVSRKSA